MLAVGAGFGCQLEERDLTIVDWMSSLLGRFLSVLARMRTLQVANVEKRHRRNQSMTPMHKVRIIVCYLTSRRRAFLDADVDD